MAQSSVACRLCGESHELRTAKNGVPYVHCETWRQNLYFNEGAPRDWMKDNLVGDDDDEGFVVVE